MKFNPKTHIIGKVYDLTQENMNAMIAELERVTAERDELANLTTEIEGADYVIVKRKGSTSPAEDLLAELSRLREALEAAKYIILGHSACGPKHVAEIERIETSKE